MLESVVLSLFLAGHDAEGALAEGEQLILTGVGGDGSDPAEVVGQGLGRERVVGNAAGQDDLVDLAVQLELINKSGSWFSIGDERIGQGRDSAKQYLIDHPDVADRIEQSIRDNMWKLQGKNAKPPASVAAKPVSISADDFNDD